MGFVIFLTLSVILALTSVHGVSSQSVEPSSVTVLEVEDNPLAETEPETFDFTGNVSKWIVEQITRAIAALMRIFDLKFRAIRFVRSIYTTDNLIFLRKLLESSIRVSDWLLYYLPEESSQTSSTNNSSTTSRILNLLFPEAAFARQIYQNGGNAENNAREDLIAEETAEVTYSFNSTSTSTSTSTTEEPFTSSVSTTSTESSEENLLEPNAISEESTSDLQASPSTINQVSYALNESNQDQEDSISDMGSTAELSPEEEAKRDIISNLRSRVMNLAKLIEARRKRSGTL